MYLYIYVIACAGSMQDVTRKIVVIFSFFGVDSPCRIFPIWRTTMKTYEEMHEEIQTGDMSAVASAAWVKSRQGLKAQVEGLLLEFKEGDSVSLLDWYGTLDEDAKVVVFEAMKVLMEAEGGAITAGSLQIVRAAHDAVSKEKIKNGDDFAFSRASSGDGDRSRENL